MPSEYFVVYVEDHVFSPLVLPELIAEVHVGLRLFCDRISSSFHGGQRPPAFFMQREALP